MIKRSVLYRLFASLCVSAALLVAVPAFASGSGGGTSCDTTSGEGCDNCISSALYQNVGAGNAIISAIFATMNNVLANVEHSFFNGVVSNTSFQQVIGTAILLYITMYGLMITFNLSSYRVGEVANRLIKVGIVYLMTAPGAWGAFNTWVQTPLVGGMNQIIKEFVVTAEGGSGAIVMVVPQDSGSSFDAADSGGNVDASGEASGAMDPAAFSNMFGSSLTTMFSAKLFTAIESMSHTGFFGWLVSLFLLWALVEFVLMIIGALFTYAKAIIGLAFLFGIAPLFFAFLLFERTRNIFFIWLSNVLTFAVQPVLLFAFLSFYVALINDAVPYLFKDTSGNDTDFCWLKWFSLPGTMWEHYTWHPTSKGEEVTGSFNDASGNVLDSPINVPNAIYFLMLCHLAKAFTQYIATLASNLTEGIGAGVTTVQGLESGIKSGVKKAVSLIPKRSKTTKR